MTTLTVRPRPAAVRLAHQAGLHRLDLAQQM